MFFAIPRYGHLTLCPCLPQHSINHVAYESSISQIENNRSYDQRTVSSAAEIDRYSLGQMELLHTTWTLITEASFRNLPCASICPGHAKMSNRSSAYVNLLPHNTVPGERDSLPSRSDKYMSPSSLDTRRDSIEALLRLDNADYMQVHRMLSAAPVSMIHDPVSYQSFAVERTIFQVQDVLPSRIADHVGSLYSCIIIVPGTSMLISQTNDVMIPLTRSSK
jgi:hypothetical protein